jgi:dTDP-4-amino-4,6-dideoxygalactose transaminase
MSDINAAIGLVQLDRLEATNARRREIAAAYSSAFGDLDWLETPVVRPDVQSSWHLYAIRTNDRDGLAAHLAERGVATGVHYRPNHLYGPYAPYTRSLPVTEAIWPRLLTLPMFPGLTGTEVDQVVEAVRTFEP